MLVALAEEDSPDQRDSTAPSRTWRPLAAIILLFAVWATVAPYAGKRLGLDVNTQSIVEVVDHVVPGLVVIAVFVAALLADRLPLPGALIAVLGGFWMSGTHVPLLAQAARQEVALGSALWHTLPPLAVFVLAAAAAARVLVEGRGRRQ